MIKKTKKSAAASTDANHANTLKADARAERLVRVLKQQFMLKSDVEAKYEATRGAIAALIGKAGAPCLVSKLGTIALQTSTSTKVDWQALARKFVAAELIERELPNFTKKSTSEPFISAPREWSSELKRAA